MKVRIINKQTISKAKIFYCNFLNNIIIFTNSERVKIIDIEHLKSFNKWRVVIQKNRISNIIV